MTYQYTIMWGGGNNDSLARVLPIRHFAMQAVQAVQAVVVKAACATEPILRH